MIRTILRIAGRDFRRRPTQSLLVVAGLLVSSLVMSAALVAGDSMEELFLANTYAAWGPVDVAVGSISGVPFPEAVAESVADDPAVARLSDGTSSRLVLRATVENVSAEQREPTVQVIGIDPEQDLEIGGFELQGGEARISGGDVVINSRLARRIDAKPGDSLAVLARGTEAKPIQFTFVVAGIARDVGKADNGRSPNVFADIEEIRAASGGPGMVNVLVISAPGPERVTGDGARLESSAKGAIQRVKSKFPGIGELSVAGSKADDVRGSKEQSKFFRAILTMLGSIVALASIALIVNLFVMLGEERRGEAGALRALGLKRSGLVLLGLSEGILYAAAAAVLGSSLGAFFGRYLADLMGDLFSSFSISRSFEFARPPFEVRPGTLIQAGLVGFIVTLASVIFVSIRTSRLTVIAAIRGLPEDGGSHRRRIPWALIVAGLAGGGLFTLGDLPQVIGGALMCVSGGGFIARYLHRRVGNTIGAMAGLAWGFWANTFLADFDADPNKAFALITTSGVVTVISGVILLTANLSALRRLASLFGARARAVFRTATGYAAGFRFRSAMSMSMFGLVVFMIAAFAIWGGFGGGTDYTEQSGGFDVFATATVPVDKIELTNATRSVGMHVAFYDLGYRVGSSQEVRFPARLFGIGEDFAKGTNLRFSKTMKGYSDAETWQRLASDPDTVVIDASTDPGGSEPGEYLTMRTDSGRKRFLLIGVAEEFWMRGIFLSKGSFAQLYPNRAADTTWLIEAKDGTSARDVAREAEKAYGPQGMDAEPIKDVFEEGAEIQRTFVGIFQLLLKMGLIIGISGLGIGAVRTVLERRQAIGILRAMGFQSWMVGSWLVVESLLVATLGVAVGLVVGLLGTYWLVNEQIPNFNFAVDWSQIRTTMAIIYAAILAFTALPAVRAARLKPSEAVRYVE